MTATSAFANPQHQQKVEELVSLAKEQGYLTYEEINDILPMTFDSPEQIDQVLIFLSGMDIQILNQAEVERQKERKKEAKEFEGLPKRSEGTSDDPVRMYLKEMGSVPLLTREEEVEISKRIEKAQVQIEKIIMRFRYSTREAISIANHLIANKELEAEKLRQLYVAMTRAKKRLYVPLPEREEVKDGTASPIELFFRHLPEGLSPLSKTVSLTVETSPALQGHEGQKPASFVIGPPKPIRLSQPFSQIHSFTSLSQHTLFTPLTVAPEGLPVGAETGVWIHRIFEKIFSANQPVQEVIDAELKISPLLPWRDEIHHLVEAMLSAPLNGFSLQDVEEVQPEVEFLFSHEGQWVKGVIDLVFSHKGIYYFLDWKTNWLEKGYNPASIQKAMEDHSYFLQADLYAEALRRHLNGAPFGGAFYCFVRGGKEGVLFFQPRGKVCL